MIGSSKRKPGKVVALRDGLTNVLAGIGTNRDKAAQSTYTRQYLSKNDLQNAYRTSWLARKIVDVPALDSVREWRIFGANSEAIRKAEEHFLLPELLADALKSARLYGHCAIYIGTNRGRVFRPIGPNETLSHLTVIQPEDLQVKTYDLDVQSLRYGQVRAWNVRGVEVHTDRIVLLNGATVPGKILGDSVLQSAYDAIRNADGTAANAAAAVFESKIDVFKIPGLMNDLQDPGYEVKVMERLRLANLGKSTNNALVMDKEEEFETKAMNFSTLDQLIMIMHQLCAGAGNIPITRLLGVAPSGLNTTGERETREYYDAIHTDQILTLTPALRQIDRLILRAAGADADTPYKWNSLWQMNEKDKAEVAKENSRAIKTLADSGVFKLEDLHKASVSMMASTMPALEGITTGVPDVKSE